MPHRVRRFKLTSTGKLIDDALKAVEKKKPKFKNVLNNYYTQLQIDPANLAGLATAKLVGDAGLIDLFATIPFQQADLHAKDILGHVYDWRGVTKSSHRGGSRVSRVQPMRTLPPMAVI